MNYYANGLLFNTERTKVALILKNRPKWQAGKYNAIGGKIQERETPEEAMIREFYEETGLSIQNWRQFLKLTGNDFVLYNFVAFSDDIYLARTVTDEQVVIWDVIDIGTIHIIPNLKWMIPLAIDPEEIVCLASEHASEALV